MFFNSKKLNNEIVYSSTKSNLYQLVIDLDEQKWESKIFELPFEMTESEMYITLSFLLDYIKNIDCINIITFMKLDLFLEKIGFFSPEISDNNEINIIKINNYYESEWYIKNTTINQIKSIYKRINYIFELAENDLKSAKKILKK